METKCFKLELWTVCRYIELGGPYFYFVQVLIIDILRIAEVISKDAFYIIRTLFFLYFLTRALLFVCITKEDQNNKQQSTNHQIFKELYHVNLYCGQAFSKHWYRNSKNALYFEVYLFIAHFVFFIIQCILQTFTVGKAASALVGAIELVHCLPGRFLRKVYLDNVSKDRLKLEQINGEFYLHVLSTHMQPWIVLETKEFDINAESFTELEVIR